jgi:hypothetical protein
MQNYRDETLTDEIDLVSVVKNASKVFKTWKKTILYFLLAGLLAGVLYYKITPKHYKSRVYISSNLLKGPSFVLIVDVLQRHINERNYEEVSRLLNLDSGIVRKIDKIQVYSVKNFAEKELSDIITPDASPKEQELESEFIIEAFVSDVTVFKSLEKGLLFYLNNNEYIKKQSAEKKSSLKAVKSKVHEELLQLDSLKNSLNNIFSGAQKPGSSSVSVNDPSAIYNNIIELYQTELRTEAELNISDIAIVQGFIFYKKPHGPNLIFCIITSILFFFTLAVVYIFYKEFALRIAD